MKLVGIEFNAKLRISDHKLLNMCNSAASLQYTNMSGAIDTHHWSSCFFFLFFFLSPVSHVVTGLCLFVSV